MTPDNAVDILVILTFMYTLAIIIWKYKKKKNKRLFG